MEFLEHFRFLYDGVAYFFKSNPVLTEDGVQMVPGWKYLVMFVIGGLLIYLALVKDFEPALLMPMGFGAILVNIPFSGGRVAMHHRLAVQRRYHRVGSAAAAAVHRHRRHD